MSCLIKRNQTNNKINGVDAPNGNRSRAFEAINSNAFLADDAEVSVKMLYNIYSDKIENLYKNVEDTRFVYEDSKEPRVYFKTPNLNVVEDIEQNILNNEIGSYEIGVLNPENSEFIKIGSFNTEASEKSKAVRSGIQQGLVSIERVLTEDGENLYKGKGLFQSDIKGTARLFKQFLAETTGIGLQLNPNGTFKILTPSEFITVEKSDGSTEVVHVSEAQEALSKNNTKNKADIFLQITDVFQKEFDINKPNESAQQPLKVEAYMKMLTSFLNSMGFTATTLENYKKAYNNRHGKDPDVTALIDLGKKVVAIAEGSENIEDLTEEVVHLALEAYIGENSIEGALVEVENTPEYSQWANIYRNKYSSQYTGLALEDAVRKEILGKIIAKRLKERSLENSQPEFQTIWDRFVNYIKSIVRPSHRKIIDRLSDEIYTALNQNSYEVFNEQKISKNGVYYSLKEVSEDVVSVLSEWGRLLDSTAEQGKRQGRTFSRVIRKDLPKQMDEYAFISNTKDRVDVMLHNLNSIKKRLEGGKLNHADIVIAEIFNGVVNSHLPVIKEALSGISSEHGKKASESLVKIIDGLILDTTSVTTKIKDLGLSAFDGVLEEALDAHNLTEEVKKEVKDSFSGRVMKDITKVAKLYGLASESSNPFISLLSSIIAKIRPEVNRRSQPVINEVVDKAVKNGWDNESFQAKLFEYDDKGKLSGHLLTPKDQGAKDRAKVEFIIEKIAELKGVSKEEAKKLYDTKSIRDILADDKTEIEFRRELKKWENANEERPMKDHYYEDKEKLYKIANVREDVIEEMEMERRTIYELQSKSEYTDGNGVVDRSKMSEEDLDTLSFEFARLKKKASPLNGTEYKEGIVKKKVGDLTQEEIERLPYYGDPSFEEYFNQILSNPNTEVIVSTQDADSLPFESRYVLDTFNMNFARRVRFASEPKAKVSDNFIDMIIQKENEGKFREAFKILIENGAIGFTDKYYEDLSEMGVGFTQQVEDNLTNVREEDRADVELLLDKYKELSIKKSTFMRTYQSSKNSFETLYNEISAPDKEAFKQLEADLEDTSKALTNLLKKSGIEIERGVNVTEFRKTINESFKKEMESRGMKDNQLEFMLSEMTKKKRDDVLEFKAYFLAKARGSKSISKSKEDFFKSVSETEEYKDFFNKAKNENWTQSKFIDEFVANFYAINKLPEYAIKREPRSLENLLLKLEAGDIKISEHLKEGKTLSEYITINPNYVWTEFSDNKDYVNPYFKKAFGWGQARYDKYKTSSFEDMFGISDEEFFKHEDITTMSATKNENLFEFYKERQRLRKLSDSNYGYMGNQYMATQRSSTTFQKVKDSVKAGGLKSGLRDLVSDVIFDKVDELRYGEKVEGGVAGVEDVKLIPIYYRKMIEDTNVISRDILGSALIDFKKSHEYKVRSELQPTVHAVMTKAKNTQFTDSGIMRSKTIVPKKGELSTTYQRLKEMQDMALFGVQQTVRMETDIMGKRVDLTRLMNKVRDMSVKTNLRFNPFVALTSATTGIVNNTIDRVVGDMYSSDSVRKAKGVAFKHAMDYIGQDGKLDTTSTLSILLEGFGLKDIQERVNETTASRAGRLASESSFKMDEWSNIVTILPRVLYTSLYDHRVITITDSQGNKINKLMNYDAYKAFAQGKNKAEIKAEWSKAKPMFDLIDTSNRTMKPKEEYLEYFSEEDFNKHVQSISAKAMQQVQRIDGMITPFDRTSAQMHAGWNMTMQHKGWMPVMLSRQFKGSGFNLIQGRYEEGYVRTAFNFVLEMLKNYKNPGEFLKMWNETATEQQKANLKRFAVVLSAWVSVIGIGAMLALGDDDDDSYLEDLAQIISYRTISEVSGSSLIGTYTSLKGFLESPVTAFSTFDNYVETFKALTDVNSDAYKEKVLKKLSKNISVYRRYNQLSDLKKYTNDWLKYNKDELPFIYEGILKK